MGVYIDLVMGLNFLVDLLLLMGANRLSGFPAGMKRCALGAALGAAYSGWCLVPGFRFLGNFLWRTVFLLLMAGAAFGWNRGTVRRTGVFLILSMALGGMAVSMGRGDAPGLCLGAMGIWMLCRMVFPEGVGKQEYEKLTITQGEETVSVLALRDSGNTLRDPVTGEQVFLISGELGQRLTGLTPEQLASPLDTLAKGTVPGLRLIPYRAVGQEGGLLLGMRFDRVRLGDRETRAVIAFAPEGLGRGMVQALVTG